MMGAIQSQRLTTSLKLATEAEQYLQENYAQADVTLEKLCMHLHISPSYFSRIFKKETRKTFHQYLTDLRMNQALTLLSSTELKTAEIAERVGLPEPSYFSYCFKKHYGYPPSGARKRKQA
jgi:two-component system response regulator YesN